MRQVSEYLNQMRNIYRKLEHSARAISSKQDSIRGTKKETEAEELKRRQTMMMQEGVGDLDEVGEFGLGVAHRDAKPISKIELSKGKEEEIAKMNVFIEEEEEPDAEAEEEEDSKLDIIRLKKKREKKRPLIDRQTAFVEFKRDHGKELE